MAQASRIFALALFGVAGLLGLYAFTLSRAAPVPREPISAIAMPAPQPAVAVIVAARDLAPGRALTAGDLAVAMQAALPAGGFASASALVGRVPAVRIPAGSALTEGVLGSGLTATIEPGERAVAIHVDENNAVNNLVKPGDSVDVFVVLKRDAAADGEIAESHARLLLPKVRVLGFGDSVIADASNGLKTPNQAGVARTAVLAVRVEDIDALSLAQSSGHLMLALRNPADVDTPSGHAPSPIARAAAGVSLTALTNGAGNAGVANNAAIARVMPPSLLAAAPMLPPLPPSLAANAANAGFAPRPPRRLASTSTSAQTGGIEVIRGSRSESVSNP